MKATYERINEFSAGAGGYNHRIAKEETKLAVAIKHIVNQLHAIFKKHEVAKGKIDLEFAGTNEKDYLVFDDKGNYTYTKADQNKRLEALRKLDVTAEYEIEPYIATAIPGDLTDFEKKVFAGFVIPEDGPKSNGNTQEKASIKLTPKKNNSL